MFDGLFEFCQLSAGGSAGKLRRNIIRRQNADGLYHGEIRWGTYNAVSTGFRVVTA